MKTKTKRFPFLETISNEAKNISIGGLWGSSASYLISLIEQERPLPGLIITSSQKEAEELYEDINFFQHLGLLPYNRENIHLYSQWNIAPYEHVSPHREIVSERLTILDKLLNNEKILIVTPVEALMHRTLSRSTLAKYTLFLGVGEEIDRGQLTGTLVDTGYKHTHLVEERGEFSVRGGIVDIFPSFSEHPIRLEFFGDEVESVREFDPETQRSFEQLELVNILPGRELILSESTCTDAKERINQRVSEVGASFNSLRTFMNYLDEKIFFPGIEWYAAYFHGELETLFDYLAEGTAIFLNEPSEIREVCQKFYDRASRNYRNTEEKGYPLPSFESVFLTPDSFEAKLSKERQIHLQLLNVPMTSKRKQSFVNDESLMYDVHTKSLDWAYTIIPDKIMINDKDQHIASTAKRIQEWREDQQSIIIASYTTHQAKRLWEILQDHNVPARIWLNEKKEHSQEKSLRPVCFRDQESEVVVVVGTLNCGFAFPTENLIFVNEDEFLGKQTVRRRHKQRKAVKPQMTLGELEINDYIVHVDHGIGVYYGLKKLTVRNIAVECLHLEYKGGDRLYVPIDSLELVQKYKGADQRRPKIDKLGGSNWARVKERVKASVEKMAEQLLETYAARQALPGVQFSIDEHLYREFEASFEYEEPPDQARAIEDVAYDMASSKPMDRLICGDVGYGKTEVAMRAAFRAILNGKQVAILVPTTILAQQHYQTFQHRFAEFPVNIAVLSRFQSRKEQQEIVQRLKDGKVDIVIGTHRLVQKDIGFNDLGLVIIDEEQRFGVTHKERIRQYRKLVDVLTLTATPIPRTLHMSLMGVRDFSVIESPPEGRLAVRTYVTRFDDDLIYDAITRELDRGGQVYFVHNEVETIDGIALRISRLLPHIRVAIAHGQMKEHQLEKIMLRFINKEIDVLVSTTIVESGLDIPSVNTMIINRAHKFGLSQLYQLRGRIGRAKDRAYAYLVIPNEKLLTSDAKKRLRVIQELSELGSGFKLAAHDLEIRGAGSLLGSEQTGHIAALGFDMYCHIIEQTVRELKGQPLEDEFYPQIDMQISAHFPESYIPDMKQRLEIYKRLMSCRDYSQILDVEDEIRDRYGKLPDEAQSIVSLAELKVLATQIRAKQIQASDGIVKLVFDISSPVTEEQMKRVVKNSEKTTRQTSSHTLVIEAKRLKSAEKITRVRETLQKFQ